MAHFIRRSTLVVIDLAVLSLAWWIAFALRFEGDIPLQMFKRAMFLWPYVVGFQYLVLAAFGVPSFAWRYVGLREAQQILFAHAVPALALGVLRVVAGEAQDSFGYAQYVLTPFSVVLVDFVLSFLGTLGVRVLRRVQIEHIESERRRTTEGPGMPTILIGAGQGGLQVAKEIENRPDLGIRPIGFIDDDREKVGTTLHGLKVLGTTADLQALTKKHLIQQALITIPNLAGKDVRRLKDACDAAGIPAKVVPGLFEIVGGAVNLSRIRSVTIEDLLRREPVELETDEMEAAVRGRVVLVTGAGGSIGSELCRQLCRLEPVAMVLVEQAENALFNIHRELLATYPGVRIVPCIANICDAARMDAIFGEHRPEIVYHAAAHKHVPMMEWNPGEAVKNNVFGTKTVADVAALHRVGRFVMISTDKAVNPTSVMGATKRVAEIYIQALSAASETKFIAVRFGNVLGSAGSVIPIFQEQIERGGPVTVTHPEMKRYFMTIPEACRLVLEAGAIGSGGEVFILDMGEPVKIVDLARDLIRLSGLRPYEDIEIQFTGLRPGEKLFEELSVAGEHAEKTRHPKIFIGRLRPYRLESLATQLDSLRHLAEQDVVEQIQKKVQEIVPEYQPGDGSRGRRATTSSQDATSPDVSTMLPAAAVAR